MLAKLSMRTLFESMYVNRPLTATVKNSQNADILAKVCPVHLKVEPYV